MKQDRLSKTNLILYACGIIPVIWLGLIIAPIMGGGLSEIANQFPKAIGNPFNITICEDSVRTVLILLLAYVMGIGLYVSSEKNYRRREEHGSAKWGDAESVNKKYMNREDRTGNKVRTQNTAISFDGHKHRRNLNVLVCGGSGSGKTRFYAKPNIMQANTSFVILDPKGEILRDTGNLLKEKGYEVKVIDLIDMEKSDCYNPFPDSIIKSIEDCGFWESVPLWSVTLIGSLFITVLSFVMIMTVYGRFFKIYLYTAIAPVPLSSFAGEPTSQIGKSFIKSYAGVCLEGAIIVLGCIIFSIFADSPPVVDASAEAVNQVWSYVGELIFNMLVLVGTVKMSDHVVKEMMGV